MYRNVAEIIVERKLDALWKNYEGCKCTRCHDDIMAYALNRLIPKYVSTSKGELYNMAASLSLDYDVEVIKVLTMGMTTVGKNPRHSLKHSKTDSYDVFAEKD